MGNLFCELGEFDRATEYFERVLASPTPNRAHTAAVLESLARVHLFRGRADSCVAVLDRIESSVRVEQDRLFHAHRYAAHTRIRVLAGQGRVEDALSASDFVIDLAARAGDGLLLKQVQLTKAELLQRLGMVSSSMALIEEIMPGLVGVSPELYARSEQILACALKAGSNAAGQDHHDRALRIYKALGSVPRQQELALCWKEPSAIHEHNKAAKGAADESDLERPDRVGARRSLHSLAMAFTQAARPDLVASELLQILVDTGCVDSAEISAVDSNDVDRVPAAAICPSASEEIARSNSSSIRELGSSQSPPSTRSTCYSLLFTKSSVPAPNAKSGRPCGPSKNCRTTRGQ